MKKLLLSLLVPLICALFYLIKEYIKNKREISKLKMRLLEFTLKRRNEKLRKTNKKEKS